MYHHQDAFSIKNPENNILNMLKVHSKPIFFRKSNLFFLLALINFLLISGLPVEAQSVSKETRAASLQAQKDFAETLKKNPWSNINGFRSAKFGMDKRKVLKAISKDFKITKDKVNNASSLIEGTTALEFSVPNLFSIGGTANLGYIFGAKSKKLIHVNIIWGGVEVKIKDVQSIVETANLLRTHFSKKKYKTEGLVVNGTLSKTSTMVFRGKDKKDRMVLLMLNTPERPSAELTANQKIKDISLVLSYVENSVNPDVRKIVVGDDDF